MKSTVKYKVIKGKRRSLCDYKNCRNLAFKEVYPNFGKKILNITGVIYAKNIFIRKKRNWETK